MVLALRYGLGDPIALAKKLFLDEAAQSDRRAKATIACAGSLGSGVSSISAALISNAMPASRRISARRGEDDARIIFISFLYNMRLPQAGPPDSNRKFLPVLHPSGRPLILAVWIGAPSFIFCNELP